MLRSFQPPLLEQAQLLVRGFAVRLRVLFAERFLGHVDGPVGHVHNVGSVGNDENKGRVVDLRVRFRDRHCLRGGFGAIGPNPTAKKLDSNR